MYHGIDDGGGTAFNQRHISTNAFEQHLKYFRNHFRVVPLADFFLPSRTDGLPRLALTFDDGLENNATHAVPLLHRFGIPATFFVTALHTLGHASLWPDAVNVLTARLSGQITLRGDRWERRPWNRYHHPVHGDLLAHLARRTWDEIQAVMSELEALTGQSATALSPLHCRIMSPAQLKAIHADPLFEVGGHSVRHLPFVHLGFWEQQVELQACQDSLTQILGEPVRSFAFPMGSYQRRTLDAATDAGFSRLLAVNYQCSEDAKDPRILDRFGLYADRSATEHLHQVNQYVHETPAAVAAQPRPVE